MAVRLHLHARERMQERDATDEGVGATVEQGEHFPAKFGRTGFRRNFLFDRERQDRHYHIKQVEAYAVQEGADVETIRISDERVVDMAPNGTLHGIELLNANDQLQRDATGELLIINEATGEHVEFPLALT